MDFEYFRQTRLSSGTNVPDDDDTNVVGVDGEDLGEAIVFLKEAAACVKGFAERLRRMGCMSDQGLADTEKLLKDIDDFVECYTLEDV